MRSHGHSHIDQLSASLLADLLHHARTVEELTDWAVAHDALPQTVDLVLRGSIVVDADATVRLADGRRTRALASLAEAVLGAGPRPRRRADERAGTDAPAA